MDVGNEVHEVDTPRSFQKQGGDVRLQHLVTQVHRLGPRVFYELLVELGATRLCRFEIEELVGRYAELDPAVLSALGADRFPTLPLRLVPQGDRS